MGNFFTDLFGGSEPEVKRVSTQVRKQRDLANMMLDAATKQFADFKPYPGATQRTKPTGSEKGIFNKIPGMTERIGKREAGGSQYMTKAREAAGRGKSESNAEIVASGMTSTLKKILQNINGGV